MKPRTSGDISLLGGMNPSFRPLKRFGQNFLIDKNIIRKIIGAVDLSNVETVLEIGPGRGALTLEMAKKTRHLAAVEVDRGLSKVLKKQTKDLGNVDIICKDILKFNLKGYVKKNKIRSFKVVANLPYYITTPVLEFLFKHIGLLSDIFITVQKEVAERMRAHTGSPSYGSLSCFVNYYSTPKILFRIKRGSFWPAPKVESCFVHLKPIKNPKKSYHVKSESLLFKVIRSAFGQRRKQLYSSLADLIDRESFKQSAAGPFLSKRPEELELEDFVTLSNLVHVRQSSRHGK